MDEQDSWMIVPMLLGGMVVTTLVGGFLLEYLSPRRDSLALAGPMFVGGTILAAAGCVAIIMTVAITKLGCC